MTEELKAGKVLSTANAQKLLAAMTAMAQAATVVTSVLEAAGVTAEGDTPVEDTPPTDTAASSEAPVDTKKMMMGMRQSEAAYTTLSPKIGKQACASCRWFCSSDYEYDDGGAKLQAPRCHLVESYPAPILPTGWCNRWEAVPVEETLDPMPMPMYLVDPPADMGKAYIAPAPVKPGVVKRIASAITGNPIESVQISKGDDGLRSAVIYTSNGYEDRESETLLTQSLKEYTDSCYTQDGTWQGDNKLLFWHSLDIGDIVWADIMGGAFLVEVAKERPDPIAKLVWDYWEGHPEIKWGASHGFKALTAVIENGKTSYKQIEKKETSVLPREAAANALTLSGVIPMAKSRADYFNQIFGIEDAAATLEKEGLAALTAKLAKRGIVPKERKPDKAPTQQETDFAPLVTDLIETQADLMTELDTVKELLTARTKSEGELLQVVKQLAMKVKTLEDEQTLAPRGLPASVSRKTELTKEEAAIAKANTPKERDTFWAEVGLDVPQNGNGHG